MTQTQITERSFIESKRLTGLCCQHLAAHASEVQGATIAQLLAIWLAGYVVPSPDAIDREQTDELRAEMLATLCEHVRLLIPFEEETVMEHYAKNKTATAPTVLSAAPGKKPSDFNA